jgi:hypothetical protein
MGLFDFVIDQDFKAALESDYRELQLTREAAAWKAVHVLAGSITEAILVDYVMGTDIPARLQIDLLKVDLGGAIKLCRDEGILSERAATLSDVIRGYRNLIHPGRAIRLGETVDGRSAVVAIALVEMIADEVGKARAATKGNTAEQLLAKIEHDISAVPIARHLFQEMPSEEQLRLLRRVVPERLVAVVRGTGTGSLAAIGGLYRAAYEASPSSEQAAATQAFLRVLREEDEAVVGAYETALFRGRDLVHLTASERAMVKAHLLGRLRASISVELMEAAKGISRYLTEEELAVVVDVIVAQIAYGSDKSLLAAAREFLNDVYANESTKADKVMLARLDSWIALLRSNKHPSLRVVEALKSQYAVTTELDELPF